MARIDCAEGKWLSLQMASLGEQFYNLVKSQSNSNNIFCFIWHLLRWVAYGFSCRPRGFRNYNERREKERPQQIGSELIWLFLRMKVDSRVWNNYITNRSSWFHTKIRRKWNSAQKTESLDNFLQQDALTKNCVAMTFFGSKTRFCAQLKSRQQPQPKF